MNTQEVIDRHKRYMQKDTHPENEGARQEREVLAKLERLLELEKREPLVQEILQALANSDPNECVSSIDVEYPNECPDGHVYPRMYIRKAAREALTPVEQRFRKPNDSQELPATSEASPVNAGEVEREAESMFRDQVTSLLPVELWNTKRWDSLTDAQREGWRVNARIRLEKAAASSAEQKPVDAGDEKLATALTDARRYLGLNNPVQRAHIANICEQLLRLQGAAQPEAKPVDGGPVNAGDELLSDLTQLAERWKRLDLNDSYHYSERAEGREAQAETCAEELEHTLKRWYDAAQPAEASPVNAGESKLRAAAQAVRAHWEDTDGLDPRWGGDWSSQGKFAVLMGDLGKVLHALDVAAAQPAEAEAVCRIATISAERDQLAKQVTDLTISIGILKGALAQREADPQ